MKFPETQGMDEYLRKVRAEQQEDPLDVNANQAPLAVPVDMARTRDGLLFPLSPVSPD